MHLLALLPLIATLAVGAFTWFYLRELHQQRKREAAANPPLNANAHEEQDEDLDAHVPPAPQGSSSTAHRNMGPKKLASIQRKQARQQAHQNRIAAREDQLLEREAEAEARLNAERTYRGSFLSRLSRALYQVFVSDRATRARREAAIAAGTLHKRKTFLQTDARVAELVCACIRREYAAAGRVDLDRVCGLVSPRLASLDSHFGQVSREELFQLLARVDKVKSGCIQVDGSIYFIDDGVFPNQLADFVRKEGRVQVSRTREWVREKVSLLSER